MRDRIRQIFAIVALALSSSTLGNDDADKSRLTLFNPTPRELMRELSTDRPDKTESAYTVDAGHVQVEMDLVAYVYDHAGGPDVEAWDFAITNFKVGLLNNLDLQVIAETFRLERLDQGASGSEERSG